MTQPSDENGDGTPWRVMLKTGPDTWTAWPDTYPTPHMAWAVAYALTAQTGDGTAYVEKVTTATGRPNPAQTTWTQPARTYDLLVTYVDRDGDHWKWTGQRDHNGVPLMRNDTWNHSTIPSAAVAAAIASMSVTDYPTITYVDLAWGPLTVLQDDPTAKCQHCEQTPCLCP